MNCSLFSERRMQCLDHVMLKSESVVTCSVFFIVYYKSATFLLVPSSFLPLLDIFPATFFVLVMPSGRQAKESELPGNLLPTKEEINNSSSYLVCLAVQRFGYCWHEGDTERKWQKRRNGGGMKEMPLTAENQI